MSSSQQRLSPDGEFIGAPHLTDWDIYVLARAAVHGRFKYIKNHMGPRFRHVKGCASCGLSFMQFFADEYIDFGRNIPCFPGSSIGDFVEMDVRQGKITAIANFPKISAHLAVCGICARTYETLRAQKEIRVAQESWARELLAQKPPEGVTG